MRVLLKSGAHLALSGGLFICSVVVVVVVVVVVFFGVGGGGKV